MGLQEVWICIGEEEVVREKLELDWLLSLVLCVPSLELVHLLELTVVPRLVVPSREAENSLATVAFCVLAGAPSPRLNSALQSVSKQLEV